MPPNRRTVKDHGPHPVDAHVGRRLRQRRTLLGLSQTQLAELLGVTFQQVQKNERGTNRLGSSRLFQLSNILDVPVSYFFSGISPGALDGSEEHTPIEKSQSVEIETMFKRETLQLVRAYFRIRDEKVRRRFQALVLDVAGHD